MSTATHELEIIRIIDAPPAVVFKTWTGQLAEWFAPRPLKTEVLELDLKTGGGFRTIMRGPGGEEYPTNGVFLEVIENERIVFTDAYAPGWIPSAEPFFTAVITFEEQDGKTKYTARALHWTAENCEKHRAMGFYEGWGQCIDQLAEVATRP